MTHDDATPEIPGRPTPEFIASLFEKYHIVPEKQAFLEDDWHWPRKGQICGCACGVLAVDTYGDVEAARTANLRHRKRSQPKGDCERFLRFLRRRVKLPLPYLRGLSHGFSQGYAGTRNEGPIYQAGVQDGMAVRRLVFPASTTPGE